MKRSLSERSSCVRTGSQPITQILAARCGSGADERFAVVAAIVNPLDKGQGQRSSHPLTCQYLCSQSVDADNMSARHKQPVEVKI